MVTLTSSVTIKQEAVAAAAGGNAQKRPSEAIMPTAEKEPATDDGAGLAANGRVRRKAAAKVGRLVEQEESEEEESEDELEEELEEEEEEEVVEERNFLCKVCTKTFPSKKKLRLHMKYHQPKTIQETGSREYYIFIWQAFL